MVDHSAEVAALAAEFPFDKSSEGGIFEFVMRVAWELRGDGCGLLVKPSGENIFNYQGTWYSISRVCYPPDPATGQSQIYKILSDAGPNGSNSPQWVDDGTVEGNRYRPALKPETDGDFLKTKMYTVLVEIVEKVTAPLLKRIEELEARQVPIPPPVELPADVLRSGDKVGLKIDSGLFAGTVDGGPTEKDKEIVFMTRTNLDAWEQIQLVKA
jgi:hypothetical protein